MERSPTIYPCALFSVCCTCNYLSRSKCCLGIFHPDGCTRAGPTRHPGSISLGGIFLRWPTPHEDHRGVCQPLSECEKRVLYRDISRGKPERCPIQSNSGQGTSENKRVPDRTQFSAISRASAVNVVCLRRLGSDHHQHAVPDPYTGTLTMFAPGKPDVQAALGKTLHFGGVGPVEFRDRAVSSSYRTAETSLCRTLQADRPLFGYAQRSTPFAASHPPDCLKALAMPVPTPGDAYTDSQHSPMIQPRGLGERVVEWTISATVRLVVWSWSLTGVL